MTIKTLSFLYYRGIGMKQRYEVIGFDGCHHWDTWSVSSRKDARKIKKEALEHEFQSYGMDRPDLRITFACVKIWDCQHGERGGFIR